MNELTFEKPLRTSKAYSLIASDLKVGIGHAYMVISPDDEVVDEFFMLVATSMYCQNHNACFECAECKKVLHNNHADIYHLYPAGNKIKVGDVDLMTETVSVKSFSGRKVYFVHRADLMNVQAQNKLLKTLEEPPKDVTIFLGVANEASMLGTIKSRTRQIYMDSFDADAIFQSLSDMGIDEQMCAVATACSEGQLGKARKIASSQKYADLYKSALYVLDNLARSCDVVKVDGLIATQEDVDGFLDVLSIILRDMLVCKQNSEMLLSRHVGQNIIELSSRYSERAIAEIIFKVNSVRKKLSLNVSAIATIDDLLFSILEAKHKWQ